MPPWARHDVFGVDFPTALAGVDSAILNPRESWADKAAYDAQALKLAGMFIENFAKFEAHVSDGVAQGGAKRLTVAIETA